MEDNYEENETLKCITCGDTALEYSEDKTSIICERCGRGYHGGYDEVVELNKPEIEKEKEKLEKEVLDDAKVAFDKMIKKMNRKNR